MKRIALAALAALSLAFGAAQAQTSVDVKDWDVFVDLPTGFAFVKTPLGWKFVRRLDDHQLANLHPTTITRLLPVDEDEVRYAHPALAPSPRVAALRDAAPAFAGSPAAPLRQQ